MLAVHSLGLGHIWKWLDRVPIGLHFSLFSSHTPELYCFRSFSFAFILDRDVPNRPSKFKFLRAWLKHPFLDVV